MKKALTSIPDGYVKYEQIDFRRKKRLKRSFSIAATVLITVIYSLGHILNEIYRGTYALPLWQRLSVFAIAVVVALFYTDVHEFVHGIFIRIFSGRPALYTRSKMIFATAGAEDRYFYKSQYVWITLAPVVLLGVILATLCGIVQPIFFPLVYLPLCVNVFSSLGDMYVAHLTAYMPQKGIVNDNGTALKLYVPIEIYNEIKLKFEFKVFDINDRTALEKLIGSSDNINLNEIDAFTVLGREHQFNPLEKFATIAMHNENYAGLALYSKGKINNGGEVAEVTCVKLFAAKAYANKGVKKALLKETLDSVKKVSSNAIFIYDMKELALSFGFKDMIEKALSAPDLDFMANKGGGLAVIELNKDFLKSLTARVVAFTQTDVAPLKSEFEEYMKTNSSKQDIPPLMLGIYVDEKPIASVTAVFGDYHICTVRGIFVEEQFRKKGYGTILINEVEKRASELGANMLRADVYSWQTPQFFKSNGFSQVGRFSCATDDYDQYIFIKRI